MPARIRNAKERSADPTVPTLPTRRVRRRYHFGSPGLVYVFVTVLIALGAFNSQNNLLFWAFGFSLATLVVSGILSGAMLMGVSVTRERIRDVHAGENLTIRYRVRNGNRLIPAFALTIEEHPGQAENLRSATSRKRRVRTPASKSNSTRISMARAFVAHVGPRETVFAESSSVTRMRGEVVFSSFIMHTSFPFGIMRKSVEFLEPASTVVLPMLADIDASILESVASRGDSDRSSRLRGPGDEFHSLREYISGDSPRSIAWKASARRGQLLVRQSLAPAPHRVWLVLRLRVATAQADALDERVLSIAAAMIVNAKARSVALGLAVPLTDLNVPPRSDAAHFDRLMRELGRLELGASDLRGSAAPFPLAAANHHSSCICIHAGPVHQTFGPSERVTHVGVVGGADTNVQTSTSRSSSTMRANTELHAPRSRGVRP